MSAGGERDGRDDGTDERRDDDAQKKCHDARARVS